nr:MAG TPA: chromosome segregation protein [Caudoviricetes sp.]
MLAQLRQVAQMEAANARKVASDNASAMAAANAAAREAAAREASAVASLRAVAQLEAANARKAASDARTALQAQIRANAESGNANKVITARLREAAMVATANAQKINANNAAAIGAEIAANKEVAAARAASLAEQQAALKAETANARKIASDAQAAVAAQTSALREASSQAVADTARSRGAAQAAAANASKIASDAQAANAAALAASREATAEAAAASAAKVAAQEKVVADATANASRLRSAAVAATEAAKIAASESRAAASAVAASNQIAAAKQKEIAANTAATASNRSWSASMTASGSRLQWIGKQLTQNFTAPVLLATGLGVKFGLDLEKSMTRLDKVYGDSTMSASVHRKEVEALRGAMVALSNTYGVQADEVANVAADWAAAGSSGAALAHQTDLTMKTMVLGEMSAEDATRSLIAIQAQWGAVTETTLDKQGKLSTGTTQLANDRLSLTTILRQLNAVENETGTSMNDLVVAFSRASGAARSAGLDTAHLAAMTAALVPAAGTAAEAGNSLKTIISRMLTPTKEAAQIFDAMGINLKDSNYQSLNAAQRLEMLSEKFNGLTGAQKAQVSASVASRYQINKFDVLMESLANKTGYYRKSLALLADQDAVVKIAEQELQSVLKSNPQMLKQAGVIIQNSLMKAMVPLIPVVIQVTQWIGKMFEAFANLPTGLRSAIVAISLILAALGPLIIMLGITRLALGQLTPILLAVGKVLLFPITGIVRLTMALVVGLVPALKFAAAGARVFYLAMTTTAAVAALMVRGVTAAIFGMRAVSAVGFASMRALWATSWATMLAVQTVTGVAMSTRMMVWTTLMIAIQRAGNTAMLMAQRTWATAYFAVMALWRTGSLAIRAGYATAAVALQATWQAASLAMQRSWAAAWIALTTGWAAAARMAHVTAGYAIIAAQKAWQAVSLLLSASFWKGMWAVFAAGNRGLISVVASGGKALVALFASPWVLGAALAIGVIVLFRNQIKQAISNVINYFRNLPAQTAKSLSAFANLFVSARNIAVKAFNSLPSGIRSALMKVVAIVRAAALKVYELFSYINPFAHHSPSLVENVTNGMAVVNQQFANASRNAQSHIGKMHAAIKSLQSLSKPLTDQNAAAEYDTIKTNAGKAGQAQSMPAYDKLNAQVKSSKAYMDQLNKSIEAQEAYLKRIKSGVEAYDAALEKMNSELNTTKSIQNAVNVALDSAKARYDRFSNAQIKGSQAAEDAIFNNTMAQKRLQLQIAKMEQESGTVDSVTDSYSKLQGEIESLTAKQTELRKAGAGSDVLGTYDKMISDLKSKQAGLLNGSSDSPASKIAALNTQLEKLQAQANIMDLEKSLKFDSLNHNLEKLKSNIEELPYNQIAEGLDSSKTSVDSLQRSYDQLDTVMAGQQARIDQTTASRDALQKVYDSESQKLEGVQNQYSQVEESVRQGEQALNDFASAAEAAVQRQEEAARAAEETAKKLGGKKGKGKGKGGAGGGGDEASQGLENFESGAMGDFDTFGGNATIGREGGAGDQSGDINAFTKGLTDDLEKQLGGLNPFAPIMKWWDKTVAWFKGVAPGFGDIFKNIGSGIGSAFSTEQDGKVTKFGEIITKSKDALSGMWDTIKKGWDLLAGLFGPDMLTSVKEFGKGFVGIWEKISGPLQNLGKTILPFLKTLLVQLAPAFGAIVAVLEVLWEVINGAIGPVFSWLGDLIGSIINIITGVLKVLMGAFKIIQGIVQVFIGLLKGLFTMDWSMFLDGFKKIGSGFADIFKGIWDIVKGIFTAIWSTIKNFVKIIWNTIWGFVKGIIDFFVHLWDVLVGHSIIPDMVVAIIDWFKRLPGTLFNLILNLVTGIINFFIGLPGKILGILGDLGSMLWGWITAAWNWVVANAPGMIVGFMTWLAGIPGCIIEKLGDLGSLLWGWIKGAWDWLTTQGPQIILGFLQWLGGIGWDIIHALGDLAGKLGGWIAGAFNWIVDNAGNLLSRFWQWVKDFPHNFITGLGVIGDKIGEWFKSAWNWVVDNAGPLMSKFFDWVKGIPGSILGKLGNADKMLWGYGKDMIQGLLNGAESLVKNIGNWFLDKLPGWIKTPFKKALGIASPSKVFAGYGQNIGQGLINGIDGMQKQVEDSSIAIAAAADKGEVGGMAISAVADTSSVGGTVSQLSKKVAATPISAPVKANSDTLEDPMANIDLDAAKAEIDAFVAAATISFQTFAGAVGASFTQINTTAAATFAGMSSLAVSTFTQMQTSVVTIVMTMVTTVNGQLQLLVTYVTAFGVNFTAAWNAAWEMVNGTTTLGVDHTLTEWQRMADTMRSTLDNGIRPVFDDMKTMLGELETSFKTTVDNIGTTWADVEGKTKKPAGIVVNEVYNKGLRGAWNKFNTFLGVKELPEYTVPYKTGGAVYGPGTGTSDSVNARLSRGEHVITAKEVQGAGGHEAIMQARQMWRAGLPAYATGGPVDPKAQPWPGESNLKPAAILARRNVHKYWPMVREIGGYRPSDPYPDHPSGLALDIMVGNSNPVGDEINEWLHRNMVPLALNYTIWKQFYRPAGGVGNLMEDRGSITQNHFDHIHALFNDNGVPGIKTGGIGGSSGGAPIDYEKIVRESFEADMDEVRKSLPVIPGGIGQWPKVSADVAEKMALKHLLPIAKKMSISTGSTASPWAGAPDASVVEKVKAAMKPYGWDIGSEWEALNQLIGHESSWNPHAANPSSTAYGLFQFLDSTWATVGGAKTDDPYQQAVYGARYIKNKYQTPSGAWAFWQNPQPNPYGGNWYDRGGYLAPGTQMVHNQTGGPEPVLTSAQWNAMFTLAGTANVLTPEDVQDAVEGANIATGNTDDATTTAIIKGMDTWSEAWTPAIVDSAGAATEASEAVTKAAGDQTGATVLLSKSLGKYDTQIAALSKALTAFSNSAQQSVKVTVNVKTGKTETTGDTSVTKNGKGETEITVEQPTFEAWAPTLNAVADLLDVLPYAERDWKADNPVAGETDQQRKARIAQNNLVNFTKGSWNVLKDVGGPMLRHTAIIGTAAEKLIKEDGPAWSAALAAIAQNNPAGYAVAVLLVLKEVATILPLILNAILDIVPALIRAIVRFLTQFMPDSVYAYADMAAAEAAVNEQQETGTAAAGQGQRYPTDVMRSSNGNENINLYMYGDLVMPNVSDGSDAGDFVDQLKLLASN